MFDPSLYEFCEYLVGHGTAGDFGRFRPTRPLECARGASVVVQTHRGLELGSVLCVARPGHAQFLPNTTVGQLVRRATPDDELLAEQMRARALGLCDEARQLAVELALPLEILDAEVLLDGRQAILHHLRWEDCDVRPLVSTLAARHDLFIALHDLRLPETRPEEEPVGCGAEGCGQGGCGSGHGGHCSTCSVAEIFRHAHAHR